MASLVPEPMEKCAVWAASPSSTTFPSCQLSQRRVAKLSQRELLASSAWSPSTPPNSSADPLDRGLVRLAGRQVAGRGRQLAEAGRPPDGVVHLDDERAAGRVVGVAVHLHDAERRLLDVELERVEDQVGAQPHVLAVSNVKFGPERGRPGTPDGRVRAVGGDDQVVAGGELVGARRLRAEAGRCTPSSAHRCCRISSSRRRLMAAKPWPPLVITSPR